VPRALQRGRQRGQENGKKALFPVRRGLWEPKEKKEAEKRLLPTLQGALPLANSKEKRPVC
jgi:hypothetical protein